MIDVVINSAFSLNDSSSRSRHSVALIRGTVFQKKITKGSRVRVFDKHLAKLVADVETNEEGEYEIHNIAIKKYFILSHHPESLYNAVIQDNVVPK